MILIKNKYTQNIEGLYQKDKATKKMSRKAHFLHFMV